MKKIILATLIGGAVTVVPSIAEESAVEVTSSVASFQSSVIEQVTKDVKKNPSNAAEIVKSSILKSKATGSQVAQIVRAAILAAPGQVHAIYNASVAVAPDAQNDVNMMIVAMIGGDEVAGESGNLVSSDKGGLVKDEVSDLFSMPSDLDVDDYNKRNKFLVNGPGGEVKLSNWDYPVFGDPGSGGSDPTVELPQVIILPNDTNLFSGFFPF